MCLFSTARSIHRWPSSAAALQRRPSSPTAVAPRFGARLQWRRLPHQRRPPQLEQQIPAAAWLPAVLPAVAAAPNTGTPSAWVRLPATAPYPTVAGAGLRGRGLPAALSGLLPSAWPMARTPKRMTRGTYLSFSIGICFG
jgi:hypothetical protein